MTNQIALVLGVIIVAAIGWDIIANDGVALLFLFRKFYELIEWMAFWR